MSDRKLEDILGAPDDFNKIEFSEEELKEVNLSFPELHPHQLEFIEHLQSKIADAVGIGRGLTEPILYVSPPDPNMHRMMDLMDAHRDAAVILSQHQSPVLTIDVPALGSDEVLIAEGMVSACKLALQDPDAKIFVIDSCGFSGITTKAMIEKIEASTYYGHPDQLSPISSDPNYDHRNDKKRTGNNKKWNDHRRQKAMAKASRRKNRKGK